MALRAVDTHKKKKKTYEKPLWKMEIVPWATVHSHCGLTKCFIT